MGNSIETSELATIAARWARRYRLDDQIESALRIEAALAAAGYCRSCGRPLSDPVSVARGVGPDCDRRERLR